ncbi:MAG: tyrosine-type recombinase/integrase, partial [bacterium]
VFTYQGSKIKRHSFYQAFRRARNDLKLLKDITPHTIRHTFVTRKRRAGFERSLIKRQVGHSTDSMFERYNHVDQEELQAMAGYTQANADIITHDLKKLVANAWENEIPLGVLQNKIGKEWEQLSRFAK